MLKKCYLLIFVQYLLLGWRFLGTQGQIIPRTRTLSPEKLVQKELEEFEREREEFVKSNYYDENKIRAKRTIMFNGAAPIDLGLLIGIPLSLALPSLSNFFQFDKPKLKRSINYIEFFEENPILQPHVERISAYFELINIPEQECQERAMCEFSANPEIFYPISELILNRIRHPSTLPLMGILEETETSKEKDSTNPRPTILNTKSLFLLYTAAADFGLTKGLEACDKKFSKSCPIKTQRRLNMPVLNFWKLLSTSLSFTLKDDLEFR